MAKTLIISLAIHNNYFHWKICKIEWKPELRTTKQRQSEGGGSKDANLQLYFLVNLNFQSIWFPTSKASNGSLAGRLSGIFMKCEKIPVPVVVDVVGKSLLNCHEKCCQHLNPWDYQLPIGRRHRRNTKLNLNYWKFSQK